jgi:putative transposase/transposase-like zinc-binding protein
MIGEHPIKQILLDTQAYWDHDGYPAHIRENLLKVIRCGTIGLGAEIYASETESKLVFHTCKSRFCTSCGQRATEAWQADLEAILPDIPYIGITLTMPMEFRTILQQNRHLLHGVPAMGAEAIIQWAKARYGVRLLVLVVQQTFGGLLNFVPHLHVMVSAGGLQDSTNRWIHRLKFDEAELMRAWRYAVIAFLAEASKRNMLRSSLSGEELLTMFATHYKRSWNIFISRRGPKAYRLKHDGRYIRRPPIAQHRVTRIGNHQVEYLAKDTRNRQFVSKRYTNEEFVDILVQHFPGHGRHAMRYFGLLSPRSKARVWAGIFVLLNQRKRQHPPRLGWRWLRLKTFGTDPLQDSLGRPMHWVGRRAPVKEA